MNMILIDAEPTLLRIKPQKHFVQGKESYQFTDTGHLRFTVSVLTPSFAEDGVLWPAVDQTFQLYPELSEQLREALRQPTDDSRSVDKHSNRTKQAAWEAVFELVKRRNPDALKAQGGGMDVILAEIERLYRGEGR